MGKVKKKEAAILRDESSQSERALPMSSEILIVLNEFRQARAAEERVFDEKVKVAIEDVRKKGLWWTTCMCAGLTLFGWFANSIIRYVVSEKMVRESVQEELRAFTTKKVEGLVKSSISELESQVIECSNLLTRTRAQLDLLKLRSAAISGDSAAYMKLKGLGESTDAQTLLSDVNAFFASTFNRRSVDEATEGIYLWDYEHVSLSPEELLERISADPGVSEATLNYLMNLTGGDIAGKRYIGLLVQKANVG